MNIALKRIWILPIALATVVGRADARPYKTDVHPSVCQKKSGPGTIMYDGNRYIVAGGGYVDAVCSIPLPTMPGDTPTSGTSIPNSGAITLSFLATYEASAPSTATGDFRCGLMYEWADVAYPSGWLVPDYSASSSTQVGSLFKGILRGTPTPIDVPTTTPGQMPFQLSFHCLMSSGSKLKAIQIITEPR